MTIRHSRTSLATDSSTRPDLIQPSDWNAEHEIDAPALRAALDTLSEAEIDALIASALSSGLIPQSTVIDLVTDLAAKQPLDADLTAIAALTTTAYGRALLVLADAVAARTALGLGTSAVVDLDTDSTLAANSDARIASQRAIKDYIASVITGGASDVMLFKGVIDASANPNYPAADAGHLYKISVAGKIGGVSGPNVEAGDTLYCILDGSGAGTHAAVGANWNIVQVNVDGQVTGPSAATTDRIAVFNGSTGKIIADGGSLISDLIAKTLVTTLGDLIYASAANTPARLAGNTLSTKKFLRSTGAAGVATAPAWDTIVENDVGASTNNAGNSGVAITIDWSLARTQKVTLTGNATITHSNMTAGLVYSLEVHTGAGAFTATFASTEWAGSAPTITATAAKQDTFTFYKSIAGTIQGAVFGQSFTP